MSIKWGNFSTGVTSHNSGKNLCVFKKTINFSGYLAMLANSRDNLLMGVSINNF
jgi:hypothetical protein